MTERGETLKEAVEGVPEASWTDAQGRLWTTGDILSGWTQEQLSEPIDWGEDANGNPTIRRMGAGGGPLLTMTPQAGWDLQNEGPPGT